MDLVPGLMFTNSHFNPLNNPWRLVVLPGEIKFREDYVNYPSSYVNKGQNQDMTLPPPHPTPAPTDT